MSCGLDISVIITNFYTRNVGSVPAFCAGRFGVLSCMWISARTVNDRGRGRDPEGSAVMAAPDVSVVISNYNTREKLQACLDSMLGELRLSRLKHEVIVVDDASTDGSAEMVAVRFPSVRLLSTAVNCGYAKANNLGMRAASGFAVFLLNSDTVILPGAISAMYGALRAVPCLAAVGPMLLNPDGTVQRSCWRYPMTGLIGNTFLLFTLHVWDDYRSWDHSRDRVVDWMSSAALMVRRSALEEVGLFDERFWVYGVDVDWALRAGRKGYRCLTVAGARIVHYGRSSWGTMRGAMRHDHLRSQDRLFRKHYGLLGWLFYRVTVLTNSALRLVVWGIPCLLGNRRLAPKATFFAESTRWALLGDRGWSEYSAAKEGRGFGIPL
jgi:GT2 family glycosyltransferase